MVSRADPIELLLPEADARGAAQARRVLTFLRLLADDARSARAASVHVDLPRARAALVAEARLRLRQALAELLAAHAGAAVGAGSFLASLLPAADWARAWSVLEEFRGEQPELPVPPGPGEPALDVAARVLAALEAQDAELEPGPAADAALERAFWRAHVECATRGPRAAERSFRALIARAAIAAAAVAPVASIPAVGPERREPADVCLLGAAPGLAGRGVVAARARACALACLLDRGAVREARALLDEAGARGAPAGDERLERLAVWIALLLGDEVRARALAARLAPWRGPLPRALLELRARVPGWLACLSGREEPQRPAAARSAERASLARAEIGAALVGVFALHPPAGARAVRIDAAPAWRARLPEWLEERLDACTLPGEREHRLLVRAATVVEHRRGALPIEGALGGEATLALALVPIPAWPARETEAPQADPGVELGRDPGVLGWLYLELEHHLVPETRTLERLARAARAELDQARRPSLASRPASPSSPAAQRAPSDACTQPDGAEDDPRESAFGRFVEALGIKTAARRWWGFELEDEELVLRARGGGSPSLTGGLRGGRLALARARAAGGGVVFDAPDARLSVHADAASGMVVPLRLPAVGRARRLGAAATGFLVVESTRRRDFREADLERFAELGETFGLELYLARFRRWHVARFDEDLWLDAAREKARMAHVFALARSRAPVAIVGPPGSGKTVLARQLHFAGPGAERELVLGGAPTLARELDPARAPARATAAFATAGTLLVEDVDRLAPELQERLARGLDRGAAEAARLLVTLRVDPDEAVAQGRLQDGLARRLDRLRVWVAPLCERRGDIPALVAFLAARIAAAEGLPRMRPTDEALGLLWRQPWLGNLRELEGLVHKLALLHAGARVGPEQVLETAARFKLELVPRLPSRRPERATLLAALDATRTAGGRVNKTRAALYLGWDPDTLVARLADQGLDGQAGEPSPTGVAEGGSGALATPDDGDAQDEGDGEA